MSTDLCTSGSRGCYKAEEHAKILASLCPQSCEELNDLSAAISAYKNNGAPRSTAKAP